MSRNFGLDLLRSLSITLVLFQHSGININGLYPLSIGVIGVEFFFVLSGFLIGGILIKELNKENSFETLKRFWIRRWFRILPLYYLVLLINFCFIDNSIGWNILYYVFFLQNNFFGPQYYSVTWSLVIEEWFYIFSPLFLMLAYKLSSSNKKSIFFYLCAFILVENILRFAYILISNASYHGINGNTLLRFDSLFIGVILAFLKYNMNDFYAKIQKAGYFFLGLLILITYLIFYWLWANPVNQINDLIFPRTIGFLVLDIAIGLMIPFIEKHESFPNISPTKKFIYNLVTYTSILTYGMYLFHPLLYSYFFSKNFNASYPIKFLMANGLTYLTAAIAYYLFEKRFLQLRDRITLPKK